MAQKNSSKKCQLGEVLIGGQVPVLGQKLSLGRMIFFSNFVGGKNLTLFKPIMILNKIHENITKTLFCENI